ncbi:MAG: NYN domain-containing protein [Sedimentisphaerales bacterium]|nr:NYN domain-containing protein [Sedimentisphaerales bacterium]
MGRYAIFIDGGYFRKILEKADFAKICYLKLSDKVAQNEERLRTYYYDCPPWVSSNPQDKEKEQQRKFDRFRKTLDNLPRFQVRLGRLARYQTNQGIVFTQKKVDILLAVDLVRLSLEHQIQRAVILAGDSDFVPAIEVARTSGVVVQLYHANNPRPHDELLSACDERYLIDNAFIKEILRDSKKP